MFKSSEHLATGIACAFLIALLGACGGDDSGSTDNPIGSGGTGGSSAGTGAAAGSSGTSAGRSGGASGSAAGRGVPTAGTGTGGAGRAGASGTGAAGATNDDDAGVSPGTGGTGGSGGSGGAAGAAGATAGAGGSAAGAGGSGGAAAGSGGNTAAATTFTEVYALFMTSCAGASCHVNATRAGDMLSMSDKATAYMNLVGVNSVTCQGEKRVVASDPAKSELVAALSHTRIGSCTRTPQMPEGKPMFTAEQLAKVTSWVMAGAKND
jgi:hypothetical protein